LAGLSSISGRIYCAGWTEPLSAKNQLAKGWNELILFAPSAKKTKKYFENLTKNKVKFKMLLKEN
jgi:hypothetical protein